MATLTDKYAVPTSIAWTTSTTGTSITDERGAADVPAAGATYAVVWTSQYKTFQCQWRIRSRKAPAVAILTDPTGADVWTDWGEWQGANIDQDATSAVTQCGSQVRLNQTFTWSYDISANDLHEYEFRVRVINTPDLKVSDWCYQTLKVRYSPTMTLTSCSEAKDGAAVTVNTGWPRGMQSFRTLRYQRPVDGGSTAMLDNVDVQRADGSASSTVAWDEPQKHVVDYSGGKAVICQVLAFTSDGAQAWPGWTVLSGGYGVFTVGAHTPSGSVSTPTVLTAAADDALTVTVSTTGTDWDSVMASVTWTDGMGNAGQADAALVSHASRAWTLEAWAPPFDVSLNVRVSVTKGTGWRTATATATLPSNGRASFCSPDAGEVAILYDLTHSQVIETPVEVVQLADGRNVERRGLGCLRSFAVAGRYITDEQTQADFEPLRERGGWILRLPQGIRCPVAIQEVEHATDAAYKLRAVTVQCAEVSS